MPMSATTQRIGLVLSIAAGAVVCAQSKILNRSSDKTVHAEASFELGAESAWPHLRQDLAAGSR